MEASVALRWFLVLACLPWAVSEFSKEQETTCKEEMVADIYILCDSSGSISREDWTRVLNFISNFTFGLPLGPEGVQVGFGIFSDVLEHQFDLNEYTDYNKLSQAVTSTGQLRSSTKTFTALDGINFEGYLTSVSHGGRPGVKKVLLVITDGNSAKQRKTIKAAKKLRRQGITIFCAGVGELNTDEIRGIAGSEENVFSVEGFAVLDKLRPQITKQLCTISTSTCKEEMVADIYILCDSSGSIVAEDWTRVLNFISNFTKGFPLGPDSVQVGFGIFSDVFKHQFDLNKFKDQGTLSQAVLGTKQLRSSTETFLALDGVRSGGYLSSPSHGGRAGVNKYLIVITDGKSSQSGKTINAAEILRREGVNTICLSVGEKTNKGEIAGIAGSEANVYNVQGFEVIDKIRPQITKSLCTSFQATHEEEKPC